MNLETGTGIKEEETEEETEQETNDQPKKRRWRPSRRGFLIGSGIAGAGVALGWGLGLPALRLQIARTLESGSAPSSVSSDPLAWFEIEPDQPIRIFISKVEMGQGIHTALAQIGAEELAVDWRQIEVVQATTHMGPTDGFGTGASNSVSTVYAPLRTAAATLREMLRSEAALALDLPLDQVEAVEGRFQAVSDPDRSISYGAVAALRRDWEVPEELPILKPRSEFNLIGRSLPRVDIPAKVDGSAVYGFDARLEGMRYGAVLRPPTIEGRALEFQTDEARSMAGVEEIVIDGDFAGVVARTRPQAWAARRAINAEWDEGRLWQQEEIEALVTAGGRGGVVIQKEGDAPASLKEKTTLVSEYRTPLAAHASMETQAALADITPERATIWASTQFPNAVRGEVAAAVGLDEEVVEVIPTYVGGGFGRKLNTEAALEAARLSKAAGVPVHVGWDRTEEMRDGYFRPPTHSVLYGRLEGDRIAALEHRQASGDVAFPFLPAVAGSLLGADFGAVRGASIGYDGIPDRRTVAWRSKLPLRTGWWRGLGLLANTFAIESFIDELAHLAGADPLSFRLAHLDESQADRRMAAVLTRAAEMAGWGKALPEGQALGIACSSDVDTPVAQVAKVSLDDDGELRIHDVWVAMDPGLVINPNGVAAQAQGAVMMGLSSTLIEEVQIEDGRILAANFDRYPLLTIQRAPNVEVSLLEAGDGVPRGVGEPPIGPIAGAVANGLFALTGQRARRLPIHVADLT